VIAVGWATPLLGITLLGFVVLDVALGWLDRPRAVRALRHPSSKFSTAPYIPPW
jgi:hypothetical protein